MITLLLKRLWPYIYPLRKRAFGALILSFLLAGIGAYQISIIQPIFDRGLDPNAPSTEAWVLAGILLGLGFINFPCRFFHFYWMRYIVDSATCQVREDLFAKLQRLPTGTYARSKQGDMISHVINDAHIFSRGFRALLDLIREPLKAIAYLGMAFWADWQLAGAVLLIAPFLIAIFGVSGKKVMNNQGNVQREHGELTHTISEGIGAHKLTKAFNLQDFVVSRFRVAQRGFFNSQMKTTYVEEMAHPFVELVGAAAFSGVIVFAHYRIQSGETTMGEFIAFVAALALFMDPIRKFSQANMHLNQARAASDRIFKMLEAEEEKDTGKTDIETFRDKIDISDLSFSYGEGDVLKDLNLSIEKGKKVAFVGLSGSGKSTLINLLLGLYPIDRGSITLDGHNIKEIRLHSLRSLFGLVSQDIFLFHDTVRDNLCLGEDFDDKQIQEALEVAYASDFVRRLPLGLDTKIGDRGTRLSGGQQQRLTIARAFLHRPEIMLFDEATSALDNESELVVQKALEQLGADKTVIAVAHRLSTIQDYDQIYVMSEGSIIETGTHHELMERGGEYAKLYELSQKK
jgi:subfamily B ATP-binding cassette protein MsbA